MAFIIIGLGNPGGEYERTRHNLGFRVIDRLCARWGGVRLRDTARHSVYARVTQRSRDIVLAKPMTYVNRSGLAAAELLGLFSAQPEDAVIIFDDNALPTGAIRIRRSGGDGGHRGMASVIEALGTEACPRIRIGIGHPQGDGVDHVLSPFSKEESALAEEAIEMAAEAVEVLLSDGIDAAMNRYNRRLKEENGGDGEENGVPGEEKGPTNERAENRAC
jgi:PTH1 family peptidyl-tRNA hydrolase